MATTSHQVSARGQMSLPADTRRRWGIEGGGEVDVFDLGSHVVILPAGEVRKALRAAITPKEYQRLVEAIDDPALRTPK